jgi:transcription elongation factor Elf1
MVTTIPGYWTCVRCGLPALHSTVMVDMDDFGLHFICTGCGRRNNLRALAGDPGEPVALVQVDDPKR